MPKICGELFPGNAPAEVRWIPEQIQCRTFPAPPLRSLSLVQDAKHNERGPPRGPAARLTHTLRGPRAFGTFQTFHRS